ncbi:uncharacterized protein LOC144642085 [Oculina patagonica]
MLRRAVFLFFLLIVVTQAKKSAIVGQLTGTLSVAVKFPQTNLEIPQFRVDGNLKGFTHEKGRLIVPKSGYYYIYAQVFFETYPDGPTFHNRVALAINGVGVNLMQTGLGEGRADYGSISTSAIKYLEKGDYISLMTVYPSALWVSNRHTFFGAYRISK